MTCPICGRARVVETSLLDHILADHPTARNTAAAMVAIGSILFSRRPQQLFAFYGALLVAAVLLVQPPRRLV